MQVELTDRYIRSLKPPAQGRTEISDTKRKGLRLRLSAKGEAVWMFEKRVKGGPKRKHTLGKWPALSLASARDAALEIELEASRGIDRVALEQARREQALASAAAQKTVAEVIEIYSQLKLATLRSGAERKRQLQNSLSEHLNLPINALTTAHLQSAVDEKILAGKRVYANRIRSALIAFSKWAWMREMLDQDVGLRVEKRTAETSRDIVLSVEEVRLIYAESEQLGPLWGAIIRLLVLTGQRRSEICKLRWVELDFAKRHMVKLSSQTKNAKPHVTHLSDPVLNELKKLKAEPTADQSEFVFTTTRTTPVSGLSKVKARLDALLGDRVQSWTFHDLRTAQATALNNAGESEAVVDRIQNHSASSSAPSAVARVYNKADLLPQRKKALDLWAAMVTGLYDEPSEQQQEGANQSA